MDSKYKGMIIPIISLIAISNLSFADTVVLNAINSGWYYDNGSPASTTEPNISTGVCTTCLYSGESRSFFLFEAVIR